MHCNLYWTGFLIIIGLIVIAYSGFTLVKIHHHSRLTQHTTPQTIQWSIHKLGEDDFTLQGHYEFSWDGKEYSGQESANEHYLNAWAARDILDSFNQETSQVWFDPSNPEYSTLFKNFPIKYTIYSVILWLLFFYFIWLGRSIKRYTN